MRKIHKEASTIKISRNYEHTNVRFDQFLILHSEYLRCPFLQSRLSSSHPILDGPDLQIPNPYDHCDSPASLLSCERHSRSSSSPSVSPLKLDYASNLGVFASISSDQYSKLQSPKATFN
ncbi:hypothetical protein V2J09_001939 [Rumex salicifolius]